MNRNHCASRYDSICRVSVRMQHGHAGAAEQVARNQQDVRGVNPMNKMLKRAGAVSALLALSVVVAQADTLMLYTSQPEADATKTVEAFRKANPDTEVQIFRSGTSDLLTKLAAEFAAGAPQPDVLLIADAVTMEG